MPDLKSGQVYYDQSTGSLSDSFRENENLSFIFKWLMFAFSKKSELFKLIFRGAHVESLLFIIRV